MSIGLKGNVDGSGAVQVGGTDAITIATDTTVTMNGGVQRPLLSGTAVASTSGTAIDFTGIPSWVKRITVMFNGVSTNGTSVPLVQIGDSGGVENTGYISGSAVARDATTTIGGASSSGFIIFIGSASTNYFFGTVRLELLGSNTWMASLAGTSGVSTGSPYGVSGGGNKTLSDTLDRVRITTVNGTDTFDAGSINILYE